MNPTLKRDAQGNIISNTTGQNYSFTSSGDIDYSKSGSNYVAPQPPAYTPTVMTDANIREKTIPDLNTKAASYTNTPPAIGSMAYDLANNLAPGTSSQPGYKVPTSNKTGGGTTSTNVEDIYKKVFGDAEGEEATINPEQQALFDLQNKMLDQQSAAAMASIRARYNVKNRLLTESQDSQTKGVENALSLGTSDRYAPISSSGILSAKERYDMQTLSDLQIEEEGLIADVRNAQTAKQFELLQKKLDLLEVKRKEKLELAGKISGALAQQNKDLQDRKNKEDDKYEADGQSIVLDLAKNMAPKEVKDKVNQLIKNKASYSDIVNAAGDYLNAGSGIIGEYNFYKRNMIAAGLPYDNFDTYQDKDANRKITVAQAALNSGNLTPVQQQTFLRISDKFQADTVMSAANKGKTAIGIADRVLADPANAGSQLSILYTLVKSLDPDSAVREGEISLAQQTQSYLSKFGTTLEKIGSGKVVATDTAKLLAEETKKLAQSWYDAGKRREGQYKSQAKVGGVGDAFDTYLGGFERPYAEQEINNEQEAETAIKTYGEKNPDKKVEINTKIQQMETSIGRPVTSQEFLEAWPEYGQQSFNDVGGDTNLALGVVGGYDLKSYATDPNHEKSVASIYSKIPTIGSASAADAYIKSVAQNSPVTGQAVMAAANKYGVDPRMMLAIMMQDSTLGTKGLAVKTFNPGNVGNTDSGATKNYGNWDSGVEAVAKNLSWRKLA